MPSLAILNFKTAMNSTNTRLTSRNPPLTPANMRRVGGGYVPIQKRTFRTQKLSVTENNQLDRLRRENECRKSEIERLKAERLQSESAFALQQRVLQLMAEEKQTFITRVAKAEEETAEQKASIEKHLLQLESTTIQYNVSKEHLEKARAELKEEWHLLLCIGLN
uniref:AlNc14C19G1973 protein n=1 Tax=Albugo laibachii Nc14 TaxID=890382 RepID=F0W502_9STRA|nr:AlNc14C19G1973 [Albugo laibachii Nc14]|eukprot:CCA16193.1 AlNc14C19G1973 [Albugo laibachii Nc14]